MDENFSDQLYRMQQESLEVTYEQSLYPHQQANDIWQDDAD